MIVVDWDDESRPLAGRRCGAALGVFDGVHRGHLNLIGRVVNDPEVLPVVVTFRNHPASFLAPHATPALLMTLEQRIRAFERAGVGACLLIDFTDEFRLLGGGAFLRGLLARMDVAKLVVGFNFRCGFKMEYGPGEIEAFFGRSETVVEIASAVKTEGETVSSSRLRSLLAGGDLPAFARVSGREFVLDLRGLVAEDRERVVRLEVVGDRVAATGQAVPCPGKYRGIGLDTGGVEIDLTVTSNYLEGPLAASSSLLYIVRK